MPRPSLRAERRDQILDAFGRCLARYGLEGASLERVADEAGLARALIRHNVGNRDQLIDAFVDRFLEQSHAQMDALVASLPSRGRAEHLIDLLFDPQYADSEATAIGSALLAAVDIHPGLDRVMAEWNESFIAAIYASIRAETSAAEDEVRSVAVGIAGLYSSAEALAAIDPNGVLRDETRAAALRMVSTLRPVDVG